MRSLFTIFLILAFTSACYANTSALTVYYKHIYSAENKILKGNFKSAAIAYDSAFATSVTPFAVDIYNNMLVGINLADNNRILKTTKMLVLKGIDTSYFRQCMFHSFQASPQWLSLLQAYPQLKKQREKTIDTSLIRQLNDLVAADQRAAHIHQDIRIRLHGVEDQEAERAFNRVEDSVFMVLKKIMENNEYLSEEKIGINVTDTNFSSVPIYYVVMLHSFQSSTGECKFTLLQTLKDAIHLGKIKSATGSNYMSAPGPGTNAPVVYLNNYYVFKDTLFKRTVARQNGNKVQPDLLSATPSKTETTFREYCYIDTRENILNKLRFYFDLLEKDIHNYTADPSKNFIFGPAVAGIMGDNSRLLLFKDDEVIDVFRQ